MDAKMEWCFQHATQEKDSIRLLHPGQLALEHWRRRMQYKVRLLVILAATAAATVSAAIAGPKTEPGECGKYMYWQEGECTDARDRKSTKSWADEMLAKQWKP